MTHHALRNPFWEAAQASSNQGIPFQADSTASVMTRNKQREDQDSSVLPENDATARQANVHTPLPK